MTIGEMHDLLVQLVDDGYMSSKGYTIRSIRDIGGVIYVDMLDSEKCPVYVKYAIVKTVVTNFRHVMEND